jgi:hypothetical protein
MLVGVSALTVNLITLAIGAALTALLGGLVAPSVKGIMDDLKTRRNELVRASADLVTTLADKLWHYWKMAQRVAYYGKKLDPDSSEYESTLRSHQDAIDDWDSPKSWEIGCSIQDQVSRAKWLLSREAYERLAEAQEEVVNALDEELDALRGSTNAAEWNRLYVRLRVELRPNIEELLSEVARALELDRESIMSDTFLRRIRLHF